MRIAIMQPYFLPYIGYFQLISAVDRFVLYDDVQYTKKGWINRNQFNADRGAWKFSIAVNSHREKTRISEINISKEYNRQKIIARIKNDFRELDHSQQEAMTLIAKVIEFEENNLFKYVLNSVVEVCEYLNIKKEKFLISSEIGNFTELKGEAKVLQICRALNATSYINPISGAHLYDKTRFKNKGVELKFLEPLIHPGMNSNQPVSIAQDLLTRNKSEVVHQISLGTIR